MYVLAFQPLCIRVTSVTSMMGVWDINDRDMAHILYPIDFQAMFTVLLLFLHLVISGMDEQQFEMDGS